MNSFPVNHTTFRRRRLQAQKLYIQLIHKGVFNHNIERAYCIQKSLEPGAILEAIANLFIKSR